MRSPPSVFPQEKQAQKQYEPTDIDKQNYIRACLDILVNVFGWADQTILDEFDQKVSSGGLTQKDRNYYKYVISRYITSLEDNIRSLQANFKAS
jgi:hypothetical protein